jgi:hypothetical protein
LLNVIFHDIGNGCFADTNDYLYYDKSGYCYWYKNGKWKDKAVDIVANACDEPREKISSDGVENSGEHVGSWQ